MTFKVPFRGKMVLKVWSCKGLHHVGRLVHMVARLAFWEGGLVYMHACMHGSKPVATTAGRITGQLPGDNDNRSQVRSGRSQEQLVG